jgi:hypothetical protein
LLNETGFGMKRLRWVGLMLALAWGNALSADEQVITLDGNFLFYNAPVVQTAPGGEEYVAYMSRWGGYMWPALASRGIGPVCWSASGCMTSETT